MRVLDLALIGTYTVVSTAAVVMIKQHASAAVEAWQSAPGLSQPAMLLAVGAVLYGVSFLLWMLILSRVELSVAYPIVIGATLATTTLSGWLLLAEPLHMLRIAGIAIIFVGVFVLTRS